MPSRKLTAFSIWTYSGASKYELSLAITQFHVIKKRANRQRATPCVSNALIRSTLIQAQGVRDCGKWRASDKRRPMFGAFRAKRAPLRAKRQNEVLELFTCSEQRVSLRNAHALAKRRKAGHGNMTS
jgi:hypothetical protein